MKRANDYVSVYRGSDGPTKSPNMDNSSPEVPMTQDDQERMVIIDQLQDRKLFDFVRNLAHFNRSFDAKYYRNK